MKIKLLLLFFPALLFLCCAPLRTETVPAGSPVRFSIRVPGARQVAVVGDFNQWNRTAYLLTGPDTDGVWTGAPALPPGRYEYLFLADDKTWIPDPAALSCDDGMGGRNSVLLVSGDE